MKSFSQILAVIRLEMKKTFFARRGLWIYLLAVAPILLFFGHSIIAPRQQARLAQIAARHPVSAQALQSVEVGLSQDQVVQQLGQPYSKQTFRRGGGRRVFVRDIYKYTDGKRDYTLRFVDGQLAQINHTEPESIAEDSLIFATIFQFYYLRLAIFFGCVGIFMNLIRGELIDKSLHFYLLTPMRREVLLIGKFLAGLIAAVVIFTLSTGLQLLAMLYQFRGPAMSQFLQGPGGGQIAGYLGVTALACAGYGSIFLAAGLIFRNPIVPAAIALFWESANLFLPPTLKQLTLIFYLQSLCPVVAPPDGNMPLPLTLLIAVAKPATIPVAVGGILGLVVILLVLSCLRARKLEINYSTDQ